MLTLCYNAELGDIGHRVDKVQSLRLETYSHKCRVKVSCLSHSTTNLEAFDIQCLFMKYWINVMFFFFLPSKPLTLGV